MRQRVKRRLFLMSMALATGASYSAFAKGGNIGGNTHFYAEDRLSAHITSLRDDEMREPETKSPVLFGKLKNLLVGLSYSPDVAPPPTGARGWRLEMLPTDARPDLANDFRLERAKRFGIALRVPF